MSCDGQNSVSTAPGKHIRTPRYKQFTRNSASATKGYPVETTKTKSNAPGKARPDVPEVESDLKENRREEDEHEEIERAVRAPKWDRRRRS